MPWLGIQFVIQTFEELGYVQDGQAVIHWCVSLFIKPTTKEILLTSISLIKVKDY
jgi:hypothetical protein